MNRIIFVFATIIIIIGGLIWAATQGQNKETATNTLTFDGVQQDVAAGAKLYDVRTAEEFASGHFAAATNFPVETMQAGTMPDATKDAKIYVYCRSGNRSGQATTLLKNAGYTNVIDLGGLSDVEAIGGTLTAK